MKKIKLLIYLLITIIMFSGFWSAQSDKEIMDEKVKDRVERRMEKFETLRLLYKYAPESKKIIRRSYGYATFSNIAIKVILFAAEGGKGIAHNNYNGKDIYI